MYTMLVSLETENRRVTIHLVDEAGALAHSAPGIPEALRWLWGQDEETVVAMTDKGPELFLIEACACPTMTLPTISLRRAHYGNCSHLPELPGLGPDPHLPAKPLKPEAGNRRTNADPETRTAIRARRVNWLRRATQS